MAKKVIIVLLIISLSFVSFADELDDSLNLQKIDANNESTDVQPLPKNNVITEQNESALITVLMGVTGLTSLVIANLISIWIFYKSDHNLSSNTLGYFAVPIIALAGGGCLVFAISTFLEMKNGKKDFVSSIGKGISYSTSYYWGCTTGLLLEFILLLWFFIALIIDLNAS